MSKKSKKSGGLTSIPGGRGTGAKTGEESEFSASPPKVVDLSTVRTLRNQENRRSVERYFLDRMIDAVLEIEGSDPLPIELIEMSETGCSFRLAIERAKALPKDASGACLPVRARLYFNRDSYLRVGFHVVHATPDIAGGGPSIRFGCQVDPAFAASEAYLQFARFIEAFARHCARDTKQASSL